MAFLRQARTENELKKLTVAGVKKEYKVLSADYNKLLNGKVLYCHKCNEFISYNNFYTSSEFASGYFPLCKSCCLELAEQREKKSDKPNETKESVQRLLQMMNLPYLDEVYEGCCRDVNNEVGELNRKAPILQYLTIIKSLPQYRGAKWKNSKFPVDSEEFTSNRKVKAMTIKRFGEGLPNEDYLFLQDQFEDWVSRYECSTKAQEELFERLCFKKLEIFKATRNNKPTKDLDESYQKLMSTANITPKQNSLDTMSEGQTLGQLIEKWEVERPIPEIDPELADVDKIGQYIDVFYKGHMAKLLNLKNPLQHIYENFIKKYTVVKQEYDEDTDSEELFDKIFGKTEEE